MTNIKIIKNKIKVEPVNSGLYKKIGWFFHTQALYNEAIKAYKLGKKIEGNAEIECKLGLSYHNLGEHAKAIKHYKKSMSLDNSSAEACYYLGFIMIQENKFSLAIKYLKHTLLIDENWNLAYYYLCIALTKNSQEHEAMEIIMGRIIKNWPRFDNKEIFTAGEILSQRHVRAEKTDQTDEIQKILLNRIGKEKIVCFGDSHRSVFNNLSNINCHNIGSATAYNLGKMNSTTGAGNKIRKMLKKLDYKKDAVLLVFGEIDTMEHIYKNSVRQNKKGEIIIEGLVKRYIDFVKYIRNLKFTVLVYGPAFSGYAMNAFGDMETRNFYLENFNNRMKELIRKIDNVYFTSLDYLILEKNRQPNFAFSADGRHLDEFPEGSKQIQAVVLSNFCKEISKREKKREIVKSNRIYKKPYFVINAIRKGMSQELYRYEQMGIINNKLNIEGIGEKGLQSWLTIDLLDHCEIKTIKLVIEDKTNNNNEVEINIIGITQETIKEVETEKVIEKKDKGIREIRVQIKPVIVRAIIISIKSRNSNFHKWNKGVVLKEIDMN